MSSARSLMCNDSDRTHTWGLIKRSADDLKPFTSVDIDNLDCPESDRLSELKGALLVLTLHTAWKNLAPDLSLLRQGHELRFLITKYAFFASNSSQQALATNQELASVLAELSQRQRFDGALKELREWNEFLDFIFGLYSGLETATKANILKQDLKQAFDEYQLSPPVDDSFRIWTGITSAIQASLDSKTDVLADLRDFTVTLLFDLMRDSDSFENMVQCYRMQTNQNAKEWLLARLGLWMTRELRQEYDPIRSPWGVFVHDKGVFRPDVERA